MASWNDVEKDAPDLAERVQARFTSAKHHTLATLRRDGAPRISGTEIVFNLGEAWLGSMSGARKAQDLQRDPRFALHSSTADETLGDGDARIGGTRRGGDRPGRDRPRLRQHRDAAEPMHLFRLDITELVLIRVQGDDLVVDSWRPGHGRAAGHAPVGAEESTVDQDAVTSRFRRSASFNPPQMPCGSRIRTA